MSNMTRRVETKTYEKGTEEPSVGEDHDPGTVAGRPIPLGLLRAPFCSAAVT